MSGFAANCLAFEQSDKRLNGNKLKAFTGSQSKLLAVI